MRNTQNNHDLKRKPMIKFCVGHNSKPVYIDSGLFLPLSLTDL